jgi:eukaryotic-like serine/threonine-protein kinase
MRRSAGRMTKPAPRKPNPVTDPVQAFAAAAASVANPALLQRRLALFGRVIFLIATAFFLEQVVITLVVELPFRDFVGNYQVKAHLIGASVMGILALVCGRRRTYRPGTLLVLETAGIVLTCTAWSCMLRDATQPGVVLLAVMLTVIARSVIVPSTPVRTLWLGIVASIPVLVAQHVLLVPPPLPEYPPWLFEVIGATDTVLWIAAYVATATVASRLVYGLAREVVAARDIGQYTLEHKLGAGGMGEVWRATHRLLIRPAAIKLVSREALGSAPGGADVMVRRFEREARITAALRSPHTVKLYDFGTTDDGGLYYAMELLEGMDLEELVRRHGPVPAERAVHILAQTCRSLSEAHRAGLIHRDIKPANIFLTRAGDDVDVVKVLDFGLVKVGAVERDIKLSNAGTMLGTPAYIAPEMVLGDREIDHRADLYALGCVGYWLLTGLLVFDTDNRTRMLLDHAGTAPVPPSKRTELEIPGALEDVIMACLAKDPDARPQSAKELGTRLAAAVSTTAWTEERALAWWSLHAPEPNSSSRFTDPTRPGDVARTAIRIARPD